MFKSAGQRRITEFKRNTARFMTHLKKTGRPSVLTVNGKPALVVMDAETWQEVNDRFEYAQAVAGIRDGLDRARGGPGVEATTFFEELAHAPDKR